MAQPFKSALNFPPPQGQLLSATWPFALEFKVVVSMPLCNQVSDKVPRYAPVWLIHAMAHLLAEGECVKAHTTTLPNFSGSSGPIRADQLTLEEPGLWGRLSKAPKANRLDDTPKSLISIGS